MRCVIGFLALTAKIPNKISIPLKEADVTPADLREKELDDLLDYARSLPHGDLKNLVRNLVASAQNRRSRLKRVLVGSELLKQIQSSDLVAYLTPSGLKSVTVAGVELVYQNGLKKPMIYEPS